MSIMDFLYDMFQANEVVPHEPTEEYSDRDVEYDEPIDSTPIKDERLEQRSYRRKGLPPKWYNPF